MKVQKIFTIAVLCAQVSCSQLDGSSGGVGKGGSLAKFAIVDNRLFVADRTDIALYDISNKKPVFTDNLQLNKSIDALFARDNKVLFSANREGLSIIDIDSEFKEIGFVSHIVACDPVVANEHYAYVTIFQDESNGCFRGANTLQVLNVTDLNNIRMVNEMPMERPVGVAMANDHLFVCDNSKIKVYELDNPKIPVKVAEYTSLKAYDIIALSNHLIIREPDGITQLAYDYNEHSFELLSEL